MQQHFRLINFQLTNSQFCFLWKMPKLTVECDVNAANRNDSTLCHAPYISHFLERAWTANESMPHRLDTVGCRHFTYNFIPDNFVSRFQFARLTGWLVKMRCCWQEKCYIFRRNTIRVDAILAFFGLSAINFNLCSVWLERIPMHSPKQWNSNAIYFN